MIQEKVSTVQFVVEVGAEAVVGAANDLVAVTHKGVGACSIVCGLFTTIPPPVFIVHGSGTPAAMLLFPLGFV